MPERMPGEALACLVQGSAASFAASSALRRLLSETGLPSAVAITSAPASVDLERSFQAMSRRRSAGKSGIVRVPASVLGVFGVPSAGVNAEP